MSMTRPKFVDSEYFYADESGWHLKEGAPSDVQKEFDEYMQYEKVHLLLGISLQYVIV